MQPISLSLSLYIYIYVVVSQKIDLLETCMYITKQNIYQAWLGWMDQCKLHDPLNQSHLSIHLDPTTATAQEPCDPSICPVSFFSVSCGLNTITNQIGAKDLGHQFHQIDLPSG